MRALNILRRNAVLAGFLVVVALGLGLHLNRMWDPLAQSLLDRQFTLLREHPQPLTNDVVVVGIDEASFKQFREPIALWHPHLADFLKAMAAARLASSLRISSSTGQAPHERCVDVGASSRGD